MANSPDPALMADFCQRLLPKILVEVCKLDSDSARKVGFDVLKRAEALDRMDHEDIQSLVAPFIEETFDHEPLDAPYWLKAATTVVIRNSQLEKFHISGQVKDGGLKALTNYGLAPLSHLLGARRQMRLASIVESDPFADLSLRYPRAWSCLVHLHRALATRGHISYIPQAAPVPDLPTQQETVSSPAIQDLETVPGMLGVVLSAIDSRFDQSMLELMRGVADRSQSLVAISALSRFSRNSDKLLRILEFILAHGARVLTTNTLLANDEVWVRRGRLVKPNSFNPLSGWRVLAGTSGAHREALEGLLRQVGESSV